MENNTVLAAMHKVLEARLNNDVAQLDNLLAETENTTVSLADVVFALDVILDDVATEASADFYLTEHRLKAIVESLDEVTQARIKAKFIEVEDNLFEGDKE